MKNFVLSLLITAVAMTAGIAEGGCLEVKLDGNLGISIDSWEINGKNYDVTFEYMAGCGGEGGSCWKLKTIHPSPLDEPCTYAPVARTGWDFSYESGDDGDLQMGVPWPVPRFTDNKNGTIYDNLTGLTWLKDAGCFDLNLWADALSKTNNLKDGECGLSDGSVAGDWRVPNVKELLSLIDYKYQNPALCDLTGSSKMTEGDPFTNLDFGAGHWTTTALGLRQGYNTADQAFYVVPGNGFMWWEGKQGKKLRFWPVRGGTKFPE